ESYTPGNKSPDTNLGQVRKGEDGRYQCPRCNKRVGDLKRHIQGVHEDQRPFKCDFPGCKSKPFKQKDNLQSHIKSVHEGKRPFKCNFPKCEWAFPRKEGLERHARIKHGLNPLLCTDCGKNCASRHALNLHRNIKHASPPVNFPCRFCGKVLKHPTARWAHERFHTHCRCPIRFCKKFFKTAEEALAHVRGPDHGHEDDFTEGDLQNLHNP
ncbi:uncharacterized protein B0J16DRAFT_291173, partial [Fusarium flagelliforme]|uniref:uncharacterized protein n=1 Tax=Fusarium flagelliforme TaxID=2675880 RepID=UPI001E8EAD98